MLFNLVYPNLNFSHKYDEVPSLIDDFGDHVHMTYELLLFISGNAEFLIENKRFELNSGDLLIIPPGQHHSLNISENRPYERYVLKFPEYEIPEQLKPVFRGKRGCYSTEDSILPQAFKRFDQQVEHYKGVDLCGLLSCNLHEILYYICGEESQPHDFKVYKENMIDIIDYINVNLSSNITLSSISQHFHYSKPFICKQFQECMDVPIMQYIRTKRVLLADSLIKNGKKPVEVYEQCGFADYSTFFRAYKKLLGHAPSQYKK